MGGEEGGKEERVRGVEDGRVSERKKGVLSVEIQSNILGKNSLPTFSMQIITPSLLFHSVYTADNSGCDKQVNETHEKHMKMEGLILYE